MRAALTVKKRCGVDARPLHTMVDIQRLLQWRTLREHHDHTSNTEDRLKHNRHIAKFPQSLRYGEAEVKQQNTRLDESHGDVVRDLDG